MDENVKNETVPKPASPLNRFKMMSNIVQGAMHQTRYMKSLEKITMDAQVSYNRMFIAVGVIAFAVIFYFQLTFASGKTGYVFIPATLILLGVAILMINFLISSRTKSMLTYRTSKTKNKRCR